MSDWWARWIGRTRARAEPHVAMSGRSLSLTLAQLLLIWFPGNSDASNLLKLSLISLLAMSTFLWFGGIQFPGGASQFTGWAMAIANGTTLPLAYTQREAGYPVLIWLTGYPYTGSLIPLLLFQATCAFLMPLAAYLMLRRASPRIAFFTGITLVVSMAPYDLMKFIHHDHLQISLLIAAAAFGVLYCQSGRSALLVAAAVAAAACTFTRPLSIPTLPVILVVALYVDLIARRINRETWRRRLGTYLVALAVFSAFAAASHFHRQQIFGLGGEVVEPSYTGAQLFYPLYINSGEFGVQIGPEDGPNTAALVDRVRDRFGNEAARQGYVDTYLPIVPSAEQFLRAEFLGFAPEDFVRQFFARPNTVYFHLLTGEFAESGFSDLLKNAAIEIAWAHPWFVVQYTVRNLVNFVFAPGHGHSMWNTLPLHQQGLDLNIAYSNPGDAGVLLPEPARSEVLLDVRASDAGAVDLLSNLETQYKQWYLSITVYTAWLMLAGLAAATVASLLAICGLRSVVHKLWPRVDAWLGPALILPLLVISHGLIVSLVAETYYRYHILILPLQIAAAGAGAVMLLDLMSSAWHAAAARLDFNLITDSRFATFARTTTDLPVPMRVTFLLVGAGLLVVLGSYAAFYRSVAM